MTTCWLVNAYSVRNPRKTYLACQTEIAAHADAIDSELAGVLRSSSQAVQMIDLFVVEENDCPDQVRTAKQ